MKTRFTTVDIIAIINELKQYIGYRAIKVYDIDCKTFLIKLSKTGEDGKTTLLIESGTRMHTTEFDWPKNPTPSGMSMKLRKHIKNRRLTSITQIGSDRIIDLQFGSNECACHFIAELYDRGNLILTDFEYTILHCGRTRIDNVEHKVVAKERYPIEAAASTDYVSYSEIYKEQLRTALAEAKPSDNIRKILSSLFVYGPQLLEHCLSEIGYTLNTKLSQVLKSAPEIDLVDTFYGAMVNGQRFITEFKSSKGFIYGKRKDGDIDGPVSIYEEFHPCQYKQMAEKPFMEVGSFNEAVDLFFSSIGTQKTELHISQKEKAAMKKLENIKSDHEKRLRELQEAQEMDKVKGEMIERNLDMVNRIIVTLNHAIANQVLWEDINAMVAEGKKNRDVMVSCITTLNLESNKVTLRLKDPYDTDEEEEENFGFVDTEIDLSMNAYSNARRYFTMKKAASSKEQKTISSSVKAMKSAEVKTKQMLGEVQSVAKINKARKVHWFERFLWFISSENYLVVGGRDQAQNELLVKKHMRPGDVYVHADIHGAATIVIQNHKYPQCREVPPKTLTEAGNMAVVYSGAWASKVGSAAWWVYHDQVSKTAPSGEYLTTGSFMVRGKKNYLPVVPLTFGFGIIFKLSDESLQNHVDERRVKSDLEQKAEGMGDNKIEEFEEIVSEEESESESEFPNTKIECPPLMEEAAVVRRLRVVSEEEESVVGGERHKYVSAHERRVQRRGCEAAVEEGVTKADKEENEVKKEEEGENEEKEANNVAENQEDGRRTPNVEKETKKTAGEGPLKRRQKNKLKKIRERYGDQDDEEREQRIAVLQGRNPFGEEDLRPATKKEQRRREEEAKKKAAEEKLERTKRQQQTAARPTRPPTQSQGPREAEEPTQEQPHEALSSLTGMPAPEDELLYALPVCAPYQTLQQYKYKVKMLPGTTKRGKAGKTVLFNFAMDRAALPREKELVRALKDQDITRAFPGTVKIYTPNVARGSKKTSHKCVL